MEDNNFSPTTNKIQRRYYRWFLLSLYSTLVISCQTIATLLGRLYYVKHGKSKWMGTLVQVGGFPILLPYYFISSSTPKYSHKNKLMLAFIFVTLGIVESLACYFDSMGLAYLPLSTFALVTSSRLVFNAFFSFFLNSMKFTPYIINSLVLLTISTTLIAFQPESGHHVAGLVSAIAGSAAYGFYLSLIQLALVKVLKRNTTMRVLIDVTIYGSLISTCITLVGLFSSGEWTKLDLDMEEYEMGKGSYLLTLAFTAINWQLFHVGCLGLIFEVSSLFSNAISVLNVPLVPILAVFIFHDKMHGIKAISLVLAIWGIVSYFYQTFVDDDDRVSNAINKNNADDDHLLKPSTLDENNA
ncbi:hypothetical protein PIB30_041841 [Stylosanthes scabra]|uniref:Probable purine permease n=1 Tax=Stylosanthes scabra TaxID=79078 RepID=A0ABU6SF77_9FABA|nr:hypothetical protein [Stylosanthes scabra]